MKYTVIAVVVIVVVIVVIARIISSKSDERRRTTRSARRAEPKQAVSPRSAATSSARPELRQAGDLRQSDFENHPVWVHCHVIDYDQPWYEDTDEETFRPWTKALPVRPKGTTFLVKATLTLADGTKIPGFITPHAPPNSGGRSPLGAVVESPLAEIQPHLFLPDGSPVGFWSGMLTPTTVEIADLYAALGKSAAAVFPLTFEAVDGLANGTTSGSVPGFCSFAENFEVRVTR